MALHKAPPALPADDPRSPLSAQAARASATIYALQALMDFDTLEMAQYDPAKKTLALFGRRTQGGRVLQPLYLDLLATAIEADGPTLTLTWTPESRGTLDAARNNHSFFNIFEPGSRRINQLGSWLFGEGGIRVAAGTELDDVGEQVEKRGGLARVFAGKQFVHVPPQIVPLAFKAVPRARPVVKGMPPHSLMANIALEADIQSKLVGEMPELKTRVAGYVPYSEWERARGDVGGEQHTWISAGKFEVQESPDGRVLRFLKTPMQFNIEKYVAGKSTPDPILTGYAQLLTSRYDALTRHFPVLHELRECAKVMAVADWLKRRGFRISFPKEGRVALPMPADIAGIVHMNVSVDVTSSSGLSIKSVMWQTGGVDLRLTPFVWPTTGLEPVAMIPPPVQTAAALKRVSGPLGKIEVPSPTLSMPGWYGQAKAGDKALKYVAVQTDLLSKGGRSAEAVAQLGVIRHRAEILAAYDRMLNDMKKSSVPDTGELERLAKWGNDEYYKFLESLYQLTVSIGLGALDAYSVHESGETLKLLDGLRGLTGDMKSALERYEAARDKEPAPSPYFAERVTELALELRKQLLSWELLFGSDPKWKEAVGMAASRAKLGATVAFGLFKTGKATIDVYAKAWDADILNTLATRRLLDGDKIRSMRADTVRKLADDVRAYEAMVK